MRMGEGVEWAAHACLLLSALPDGAGLPAAAIAAFHDVPPAYLAKHMQALARAGIVTSARGASGGYRLARAPEEINLLQIADAVDGGEPAFRCTEIRQRGPCAAKAEECMKACGIAAAFWAAERIYRQHLEGVRLADIRSALVRKQDSANMERLKAWLEAHANN
ncbi:rrf2 family protein [Hyphomonas neptunium ATCC 15444]|uniref:Rrf2 family protein n=2 Tax=Hyphomonas TaxID=85 RepID=Q0C5N0_HYPNA|nr:MULTISPECIES: Rrf2 family transcriptional regulator [Hyphomonas]ABI76371.1 rrf2 family protein [Hyphomonas neptunium ATCC 15444]KCZ95391.1 rrf2 family protein [Hyphomonas hirschiana VP5]